MSPTQYWAVASCETGNVLYKQFSQAEDDSVCQFECLPGYVKVSKGAELDGGDCKAGPLPDSVQNYWSHTANVTHVQRVRASTSAQDGTAAFKFTVSHTNHGHFVVLAGNRSALCEGREKRHRGGHCCLADLYRVSTKLQMGLAEKTMKRAPSVPPCRQRMSVHTLCIL